MFHHKESKFPEFSKNLLKYHFWLVGRFYKNFFHQALLNTSVVDPCQQLPCNISAKLDNSLKSYATFLFLYLRAPRLYTTLSVCHLVDQLVGWSAG